MDSAERAVLIAGCGYVGLRLGGLLAPRARVWGLRRDPGTVPPPISPLAADLRQALPPLPGGIVAAVFAAAPESPDRRLYRSIYVDGLRRLIDALLAVDGGRGASRLVFCSSTSVYGQQDGSWVDERSATRPASWRGEVLLEAEGLLRQAPLSAAVARLSGIYGPGRSRLLRRVAHGRAPLQPEPSSWTNRIHRDDCAGALAHLLEIALPPADAAPLTLLVSDDRPIRRNDLLRHLAGTLDAPPPPAAQGPPPPQNKRCGNAGLRASGYRLRFPSYREGFADVSARHKLAASSSDSTEAPIQK